MNFTSLEIRTAKVSKVGIIGATKGYGYTFLAQLLRVPQLSLRVICSRHADECRKVLAELGYSQKKIQICTNRNDITTADSNAILIVDDYRLVMECGITSLVECTGKPSVGLDAAQIALHKKINVYMVSKETDSVCGPMLNRLAAENGVVYTLVKGDQPRNLIDLYSWAKLIGLDVIAAGKASEYDFVYDTDSGEFSYLDYKENLPDLKDYWHYVGRKTLRARHHLLEKNVDVISADLCEMNLVSNATGLIPAAPTMHYPIAKISELADIFSPVEEGGILGKTGVLDVFFHLRGPDEASFAGGVFVIVRCENKKVWKLLTQKGHVVSKNGKYACIYEPYHLMGIETIFSVILGDRLGIGTHAKCRQVSVLVGEAKQGISAGTKLKIAGHHHSIEGLTPKLLKRTDTLKNAVPFYLLDDAVVTKDILPGSFITLDNVEIKSSRTFTCYQQGLKL